LAAATVSVAAESAVPNFDAASLSARNARTFSLSAFSL
jgi:hypothetical protein